jgi:hypothetical protein
VVHGRVGHDHGLGDLLARHARLGVELADQLVQPRPDRTGQRLRPVGVPRGVGEAADDVLAVGDLRVGDPGGGELVAGGQVDEVARDLRGAEVHRHAERGAAGRENADQVPAVHERQDVPVVPSGDGGQLPDHGRVGRDRVDAVGCPQRRHQPVEIAALVGERGRFHRGPQGSDGGSRGRAGSARSARPGLDLQPLRAEHRGPGKRHGHVAEDGGPAGEAVTGVQRHLGEGAAVGVHRRAHRPRDHLHPAAPAGALGTADGGEAHPGGTGGVHERSADSDLDPAAERLQLDGAGGGGCRVGARAGSGRLSHSGPPAPGGRTSRR